MFKDPVKKSLYTLSCDTGVEGDLYIKDVIPVPSIGLTGTFFLDETGPQTKIVREGASDQMFISEIDNLTDETTV